MQTELRLHQLVVGILVVLLVLFIFIALLLYPSLEDQRIVPRRIGHPSTKPHACIANGDCPEGGVQNEIRTVRKAAV